MTNNVETFTTRIFLNDSEAKDKLAQLSKDVEKFRKQMLDAADAGKWDNFKEAKSNLNKAIKEMDSMKTSAQKVANVLNNLKTASYKELKQTITAINKELRSGAVKRNSEDWKRLNVYLKQCRQQLNAINNEGKATQPWFKRLPKFFNDNWGIITQAIGTFTGLTFTVRKAVNTFAQMDEAMANTRKYTSQTDKQVREMNEDFKTMNTRTPREQLNELAGAAGRLGIQSKKSIEEFVDAADKINVALGDDLGEGAVDKIGKLAQVFGEDKTKGLRGAMLATGSAINELAQSSSANAGYIVDFAADLAGVGKQAGMSQQDIMGLASALDQNMQEEKTSATVFSQLITKMYQDPAKFAAIAGIKVKEFSKLLKEDANKALLEFMQSMQNKGGFAELAPMFESMNLDGTRAVGVLSAVATHLDQVRIAQDTANKAYASGSSVIQEYNIQNTTVQAGIDKAKKQFNELVIELGEKLEPVAKNAISLTNFGIRSLSTIVSFVIQYRAVLIRLGAYITAFMAIQNALIIKEKILYAVKMLNLAVDKVFLKIANAAKVAIIAWNAVVILLTRGFKGLNAYMRICRKEAMTNPYTALATALLTLSVVIIELVKNWDKLTGRVKTSSFEFQKNQAIAKDMKDVHDQMKESISDEAGRTQRLYDIVKSSAYTYEQRKNAIAQLQKIVPNYHASLTREGVLHEENAKAIDDHINALNDLAMAQALQDKLQKIQGDKFEAWQKLQRKRYNVRAVNAELQRHPERYNATETVTYENNGETYTSTRLAKAGRDKRWELQTQQKAEQNAYNEYKIQVARENEINNYLKTHKSIREKYYEINTKSDFANYGKVTPPTTPYSSSTYVDPKKAAKAAKAAETARKKAEAAAKKRENEMKAATRKAYQEEIKAAKGKTDEEQAQNIIAYSQGKKKYSEYLNDQHDIAIRGYKALEAIYKKYGTDYGQWQDEIAKEEQKKQEDHQKALLSDVEINHQREIYTAKSDYNDPSSEIYHNEEALNERLFEIDMSALADRTAVLQEGSQEWLDAKAEMTQKEEEHELYLQQHYAELLSQYREQWGQKDVKDQERIALNGLDTLHEKGIIKEKEYQEMLRNIKLHYALEESQNNLNNSKGEQFKRNADTAYQTASNNAKADYENDHPYGTGMGDYYTSDVTIYASTLANIKKMEQQGVVTHQEAMAAMSKATADMCNGLPAKMQAAYEAISPIMSAMSSYYSAQSDYEVTVTEKKYDKMIEKAGNNSAKSKKLEEKKQKEVAKIKTKYAKKQMKMEIAQAIAQTAMSAIAAYGSAMSGVPYPANLVLAPIAAGIALAAGAIQIATIKKQQQAQEAGYYEGGFTGGNRYRREAGVVHEGEFVANHNAVNNPQLLPALRLIDVAQRNNTVGRLTAADVSRAMGTGGATVVSAPTVNVQTDNSELTDTLQQARDTLEKLGSLIDGGITANVSMENFKKQEKHWNQIQKNK